MIKLNMVSIPVKDQNRALKFYTDALGFTVHTDVEFAPGMRWIELSIPNSDITIALFTPPEHEDRIGSFSNITFKCENNDLQQTYEKLKHKGVEFTQPPKEESWGKSALFKDSEGNEFCLSQSSN